MVIHSCTSQSYSGLENYALDLATWQYRQGKPVELFCREGTKLDELAQKRGLPVWTIGHDVNPGPFLWAKMRAKWASRLQGGNVTLHMHAGGEPMFHLPWLLKRSDALVKTVLHFHIWINHKKKDPLHRLIYRGVDEVWTSSETARAHLATLLPVTREKIRVVPYGRDVSALLSAPAKQWRGEMRTRFGIKEDDVVGVCVSRLEKIKGVGELFEAFTQVAPRFDKAHLVIVGDASPNNPEAKAFADDLHARHQKLSPDVRARLHLPGYMNEALHMIAAADFYVLPSYEECMSLAMLDAAILGLPILGTSAGGTPAVARPDETGMLVPPGDAPALAAALEKLYANPENCRKLGEGARALGPSFNQENIFNQIWNWYAVDA